MREFTEPRAAGQISCALGQAVSRGGRLKIDHVLTLITALALLPPVEPAPTAREGRHSVELSYFGYQLTRPGGLLGYSWRAVESRRRLHALVVGADVGGFVWPHNSIGLLALPRVGWRGRHRSGLQGEANFHLGYQHTFLPGENYEVVGGVAMKAPNSGYPSMLFGGTIGIGWFFPRVGLTPFARLGALGQFPVFDQLLARLSMSVGIEVRI